MMTVIIPVDQNHIKFQKNSFNFMESPYLMHLNHKKAHEIYHTTPYPVCIIGF